MSPHQKIHTVAPLLPLATELVVSQVAGASVIYNDKENESQAKAIRKSIPGSRLHCREGAKPVERSLFRSIVPRSLKKAVKFRKHGDRKILTDIDTGSRETIPIGWDGGSK